MTAPKAPEGFRDVQAEAPLGPRVEKEALCGVIVRYERTARFPKRAGSGTTVVHGFRANPESKQGKAFSVFGTADLDSKLRNVRPGSVVWILYLGKKTMTDGQDRHVWSVSNAGQNLDAVNIAQLQKNSVEQDGVLDRAIVQADADYRARRDAGTDTAPDYDERDFTDDEVPVQ